MIKNAQNYIEKMNEKFRDWSLDERYKYYFLDYYEDLEGVKSDWNGRRLLICNKEEESLGLLTYSIDRVTNNVRSLCLIKDLDKNTDNFLFTKEILQILDDLFIKYKYNKLSFSVAIGNSAEKFYDKWIEKVGGRIVGVKEKDSITIFGDKVDMKMYEVLKENYKPYLSKNSKMEERLNARK